MKTWNHLKAGSAMLLAMLGLFLCQAPLAFGATAPLFSISLGFDFASGDYGTTQTTDSYSIPLTIGYYPTARFDLSLEIPYNYQSDSSTVTLAGNSFPVQNTGGMNGGRGPGGGMNVATAAVAGETTLETSSSQSGLGDISLTAGFILVKEMVLTPMVRPLLYMKVPTADSDQGLGTGAFDFGAGLSTGKGFGKWSLYAEGLYIFAGSSSLYEPDDYLTFQGSLNYQLTQKLVTGCEVSGGTAAFADSTDALEVKITSSYRITPRGNFGAYLGRGLTDGSPDTTTGVFGSISF
jgi:hypothetical protein